LTTVKGEVTKLTSERDTAKAERETAVTQLGEAGIKITKLEASQKDFDIKLSAELVKFGVRRDAITLPIADTKSDGTKMTATEQCLAAKLVPGK
jgi:predicted  nucleic acid-binding Zn-ribbon protein